MKDLVSRHNCPEIVAFTIRTVSAAAVRARVEYNASNDGNLPLMIPEAPLLQSRSVLYAPPSAPSQCRVGESSAVYHANRGIIKLPHAREIR